MVFRPQFRISVPLYQSISSPEAEHRKAAFLPPPHHFRPTNENSGRANACLSVLAGEVAKVSAPFSQYSLLDMSAPPQKQAEGATSPPGSDVKSNAADDGGAPGAGESSDAEAGIVAAAAKISSAAAKEKPAPAPTQAEAPPSASSDSASGAPPAASLTGTGAQESATASGSKRPAGQKNDEHEAEGSAPNKKAKTEEAYVPESVSEQGRTHANATTGGDASGDGEYCGAGNIRHVLFCFVLFFAPNSGTLTPSRRRSCVVVPWCVVPRSVATDPGGARCERQSKRG